MTQFKLNLNQLFMISHHNHNTIAPMEGLRGFAAFMVFLVHFSAMAKPWVESDSFTTVLIFNLRFIGATGVDLFFVLSGFLIYGMLIKKSISYKTYARRRLKRIYPTFLFVTVLYITLSFFYPSESKIPEDWNDAVIYIIQCLLLLPGIINIEPLMTVAWTLSYEVFFYLTVPLVIMLFQMRKWNFPSRVVFIISISVMLYLYNLETSFYIRMLMFLSGMILFEVYSKDITFNWNKAHIILPITFLLMLVFRNVFFDDYGKWVILIMFLGYALICLDIFQGKSVLGKLFKTRYFRCYGNMSYSYYLIHGLTLKFLFLIFSLFYAPNNDATWVFYVLLIPFFVITLIVSSLLFITVERPMSLVNKK